MKSTTKNEYECTLFKAETLGDTIRAVYRVPGVKSTIVMEYDLHEFPDPDNIQIPNKIQVKLPLDFFKKK